MKATVWLTGTRVGLSNCYYKFKVRSLGQRAPANRAAPPTASVRQYATLNCKPLLFGFPCNWRNINVWTSLTFKLYDTEDDQRQQQLS